MKFDVGAWAEFVAAGDLTRLGCHVFFPRAGQPPADIAFMVDGKTFSGQVKYSTTRKFDLRHNSHKDTYPVGAFDYFVLVHHASNGRHATYLVPHTRRRVGWTLTHERERDNSVAVQIEVIR